MLNDLFIGVDGGGTKCSVRVEDVHGQLLGIATGGAANIRLSVDETWENILTCLNKILSEHAICLTQSNYRLHAGMGLAGCEVRTAYEDFLNHLHPFHSLVVSSDAHTACIGAHQGKDGAIIIAGTGIIGWQNTCGKSIRVGGFGFPHDDLGSGAWLGLEATKIAIQTIDGRQESSQFSQTIFEHFQHNNEKLISWANRATSSMFAELAPLVISLNKQQDTTAINLLKQAAGYIDEINQALIKQEPTSRELPCCLLGGIAPFLLDYISDDLKKRLVPCALTPAEGAILLAKLNKE